MASPSENVALVRYVQVIVSRKKFIASFTGAAAILAVIVALLLPKKYEARSLVMPPQMDQGAISALMGQAQGIGAIGDILGGGSTSDIYSSILKSDAVKNKIIDRFKYLQEFPTRVDASRKLDSKVKVDIGKKDGIVAVTAEDESPQRAADLANAYIDELDRLVMRINVQQAGENRAFLEGRIALVKAELQRMETEVKNFRSRSRTVDIVEQSKATIEGIGRLKAQLAAEEARLAGLRTAHTDNSPEVVNVRASIATLRGQLTALEGTGGGGGLPSLGAVPALGEEYQRLLRNQKVQEVLLESLTKQYEMARLGESRTVPAVVVVQRADVPDKKSSPKRTLIVLMTTAVAFVFAVFAAFGREIVRRLPEDEKEEWRRVRRSLFSWRSDRQSCAD